MQDVQNIPNPDVNSTEREDEFGNHSGVEQDPGTDETGHGSEVIPVPPDVEPTVPVEDPPGTDKPPIGEDGETEPERIA